VSAFLSRPAHSAPNQSCVIPTFVMVNDAVPLGARGTKNSTKGLEFEWARILVVFLAVNGCAVVNNIKGPTDEDVTERTSTTSGGDFPFVNAWTAQHKIILAPPRIRGWVG